MAAVETPPIGKYSICCVAALQVDRLAAEDEPEDRRDQLELPVNVNGDRAVRLERAPLLLQLMSMSASATSTIEPFDSSWTRHTIRFVVVLHGWPSSYESGRLRRLEGALARGIEQRDVRVVDPAEVEDRRQEDEEQRQDECELDQALAPGSGPPPASSEEFEQVHLGHRCGFGVSATRMLGAVTYTLP